jgi:hypothetical protein
MLIYTFRTQHVPCAGAWLTTKHMRVQNPVLNGQCTFEAGKSYCVAASTQGAAAVDKSPSASSKTSQPSPTSKTGPNGVATPLPTQAGMTTQCQRFHLVSPDAQCQDILDKYAISLRDFVQWNPAVGATCTSMWAETYVCVGVGKGKDTASPSTPATPASPPSATPSPIQSGMVKGCKKFHFVKRGEGCWDIQRMYGISMEQIYRWNPAVGRDCITMWADSYLCVGV